MTLKEKEHKIKLIRLIILVDTEYVRRHVFKDVGEMILFVYGMVPWVEELKKLITQKTIG